MRPLCLNIGANKKDSIEKRKLRQKTKAGKDADLVSREKSEPQRAQHEKNPGRKRQTHHVWGGVVKERPPEKQKKWRLSIKKACRHPPTKPPLPKTLKRGGKRGGSEKRPSSKNGYGAWEVGRDHNNNRGFQPLKRGVIKLR